MSEVSVKKQLVGLLYEISNITYPVLSRNIGSVPKTQPSVLPRDICCSTAVSCPEFRHAARNRHTSRASRCWPWKGRRSSRRPVFPAPTSVFPASPAARQSCVSVRSPHPTIGRYLDTDFAPKIMDVSPWKYSRIRIFRFSSHQKREFFLRFFEMTYQKVVWKSLVIKFSHQSVKLSSYTLLSDHCNSVPSSRSVIHYEPLQNANEYRNFGLQIHFWARSLTLATYQNRLSVTVC